MSDPKKVKEEMLWVGCNDEDPELFKEQSKKGFKLMEKLLESEES